MSTYGGVTTRLSQREENVRYGLYYDYLNSLVKFEIILANNRLVFSI
jgi:hypothetical protein